MPTQAEVASLHDIARVARQQLSLSDNEADWTFEDRLAHMRLFKEIFFEYASGFSPEVVRVVQSIDLDYPMAGFSSPAVWTDAVLENAGNVAMGVYNLGRDAVGAAVDLLKGAARTVSFTATLAPFFLPVAIGVFIWMAAKTAGRDPGGQFSKFVGAVRK